MLTYVTTLAALVADAYASTTAAASESFIRSKVRVGEREKDVQKEEEEFR